jgi:Trk K+ transport system NAD-binding subunit
MGVVGKTIAEIFRERDIEFVVVDLEEKEGVDIVGDITHEDVLKRAGIEDASAIILAVNDDAMAIFTTLIIAKTYPNTEIIARVSDANSINMVYRAGADYVLSLPTVSGRMLFSILEETDEVLSTDTMYEVVRTRAPQLAGQSLEEANIRKRTGCTVVAVEREEQLLTNLKPNFEIEKGDQLIVVGSDETINKFRSFYC